MRTSLHVKSNGTVESKQLVVPFSIKADSIDKTARTFEGLASVWGLDLGGDIMHRGAFANTLQRWRGGDYTIPLLNSHNQFDINAALGQLLDAKETDQGLWTKWGVIDGPDGDGALIRIRPDPRSGRATVTKMSIGFTLVKFDFEESPQSRFGQLRHLREVELLEVSLVLFPMAPGASVDADSVKRRHSIGPLSERDRQIKAEIDPLLARFNADRNAEVKTIIDTTLENGQSLITHMQLEAVRQGLRKQGFLRW